MQYPSAHELWRRLSRAVWNPDIASLPWWRARFLRWVRLVYLVGRDLTDGQLNLQAMSLVYTTLLSLVPLLAVSFSVLKAFDVHNQIEPIMLNFMTPLGERGAEITANVIGFVDNIKVGVLGAVGLGLLIYTVISLVQKIERAFNFTWHVRHGRSFVERFRDYLSVIMIGPVLVFSALGATASLMNNSVVQALVKLPGLAWVVESIGTLVPYLFVIAAFTFVYKFVPNTRVRLGSAAVGALVAGFLWQTIGWGFASFVVTSAKYAAIYSGFAILVFFMIWLYVAWLILLVGASIAFYHQHPEYLTLRSRDARLSNRLKERLALSAMYLITQSHFRGTSPWTAEGLAKHLAVPTDAVTKHHRSPGSPRTGDCGGGGSIRLCARTGPGKNCAENTSRDDPQRRREIRFNYSPTMPGAGRGQHRQPHRSSRGYSFGGHYAARAVCEGLRRREQRPFQLTSSAMQPDIKDCESGSTPASLVLARSIQSWKFAYPQINIHNAVRYTAFSTAPAAGRSIAPGQKDVQSMEWLYVQIDDTPGKTDYLRFDAFCRSVLCRWFCCFAGDENRCR